MLHLTIADLVFTRYSDRRILTKDNYKEFKNQIKNPTFFLLLFCILTSCKSEPKKQHQHRQILHDQTHLKYDERLLVVPQQTDIAIDQETNAETDSLKRMTKIPLANPIQNPIGIAIPQKKLKSSSRQRKGKIIYTSERKKKNQWKKL